MQQLKCYDDQNSTFFFSSVFESVIAKHFTGDIMRFNFYPKAVFFECKFLISRSAIGSRGKVTSLNLT